MQTYRTEGIILQALKFQDYDQILTIFTPGDGILKLMMKGAFSHKNGKGTLTAPLSRAEFIYTRGKGELYACREISMLNQHLNLRQTLALLEAALDLLQTVYRSQVAHKAAPDLYKLLVAYLEKMMLVPDPQVLASSYRLKVLRHDGFLHLGEKCSSCQAPLPVRFCSQGESFCRQHAPPGSLEFSAAEATTLELLAYAPTLSHLTAGQVSPELARKIRQLFEDLLAR